MWLFRPVLITGAEVLIYTVQDRFAADVHSPLLLVLGKNPATRCRLWRQRLKPSSDFKFINL